jgi:hypothetical protein
MPHAATSGEKGLRRPMMADTPAPLADRLIALAAALAATARDAAHDEDALLAQVTRVAAELRALGPRGAPQHASILCQVGDLVETLRIDYATRVPCPSTLDTPGTSALPAVSRDG